MGQICVGWLDYRKLRATPSPFRKEDDKNDMEGGVFGDLCSRHNLVGFKLDRIRCLQLNYDALEFRLALE